MMDDRDRVSSPSGTAPNGTPGTTSRPAWSWAQRLLIVLVPVALLAVPLVFRSAELVQLFANREQVVTQVRSAGAWGPLLVIGLVVAQTIFAPLPGQAINLVAGYLYGWAAGLLFSWLGLVLGSAMAMGLARYAGRPLVERLVPRDTLARLDQLADRGGWPFFFLAFLIPGLPDDALCFVAGLTPLPLRWLILLSATARVPGMFAVVWLGAHAEQVPWQIWAVGGAVAAAGLGVAWRFGRRIQDSVLRRLADGR